MSVHDTHQLSNMPAPAPLEMQAQDLHKPFTDPSAPGGKLSRSTKWLRVTTFIPALATTGALMAIFLDWFQKEGFLFVEIAMLFLVSFSAFWIALSVSASTIGFFARPKSPRSNLSQSQASPLSVALLVPVYNEDAVAVFQRISAMRDQLARQPSTHRFAFFVLSDTQDDLIALAEVQEFERLRRMHRPNVPIFYRRRLKNTERKTGNIRDWITTWGADWNAFITLDADSVMAANTINQLADELSISNDAALIQSVPHLVGANTLFARALQFSNNTYGPTLSRGLNLWSGDDGNYWGHNAIVRTTAFATCAGLPTLSGKGALGGVIKSHDFVEAALLRRAGWAVRMLPELRDSYEETPQNMIDYVMRDRRWCQGNLQHMRLLLTPGLTLASRFHMLQGAMSYIASCAWFFLLILWALMGRSEEQNVIRYFTDANPLFPQWPQMETVSRLLVLGFMVALLLLPKIFALTSAVLHDRSCKAFGGRARFAASTVCEILLSFILAPILMVQHVLGVARTILGFDTGWAPQNRQKTNYRWITFARFHILETCIGALLMVGYFLGVISLWLVPIALCLLAAIPLTWVTAKALNRLQNLQISQIMSTPEMVAPSKIVATLYDVPVSPAEASTKELEPVNEV